MITLDNFENFVPYKILMRGEEYYDTDAVSELEETSPGEWTATVEGTDDYNVGKRLRDSILLSVFSSHIFARYKNEALWI